MTRALNAGRRAGQGRPLGFLAAWGSRCPGPEAEHKQLAAAAPGQQPFLQDARREARSRLKEEAEYLEFAGQEAPAAAGDTSEPEVVR